MENGESSNKLLETEGGMFQMEISDKIKNAYELIDASTVTDAVKEKCKEILKDLVDSAESQKDKTEPYDLCRGALLKLLDVIDEKDEEQNQLFEAVKKVILDSRNSALGWEN